MLGDKIGESNTAVFFLERCQLHGNLQDSGTLDKTSKCECWRCIFRSVVTKKEENPLVVWYNLQGKTTCARKSNI